VNPACDRFVSPAGLMLVAFKTLIRNLLVVVSRRLLSQILIKRRKPRDMKQVTAVNSESNHFYRKRDDGKSLGGMIADDFQALSVDLLSRKCRLPLTRLSKLHQTSTENH
jgi:hypothetical protein